MTEYDHTAEVDEYPLGSPPAPSPSPVRSEPFPTDLAGWQAYVVAAGLGPQLLRRLRASRGDPVSLRTVIDWLFPEPSEKGLVALDDRPALGADRIPGADPDRDYSLGPDFDDGPPVRRPVHLVAAPSGRPLEVHGLRSRAEAEAVVATWEGLAVGEERWCRAPGGPFLVRRTSWRRWHGPDDVL